MGMCISKIAMNAVVRKHEKDGDPGYPLAMKFVANKDREKLRQRLHENEAKHLQTMADAAGRLGIELPDMYKQNRIA